MRLRRMGNIHVASAKLIMPKHVYPWGTRILAYLLGCIPLALATIAYLERQSLGFPNGHLTEVERAQKTLLALSTWTSLLFSGWFAFLGWMAARRRVGTKLCVATILYVLVAALLLGVDRYLRQHLEGGGGG